MNLMKTFSFLKLIWKKKSQCKYIVLIIDCEWYDYMLILKYIAFVFVEKH